MKNIAKYVIVTILIVFCSVYLFNRCPYFEQVTPEPLVQNEKPGNVPVKEISDEVKQKVKSMTLEEKIYQMFYVTPEQLTGVGEVIQAGATTKEMIEKYPVGGIVYSSHNLQTPEQAKSLLGKSQEYAKFPMFLGVFEEGGSNTVIGDNSSMGLEEIEMMADVSDYDRAYEIGGIIGEKLAELGLNMNFAPVSDVIGDECVNVIGLRSFGNDYNSVSKKVEQYVMGMQEKGISATLKHFPGQGYTEGGTELDYVKNNRSAKDIKSEELAPFKKGIEADVDFIMVGNIKAKNLDPDNPAPFSYKIVTELLKEELGYTGIIITAPLTDGAVKNWYTSADAAKEAVKAGVDMLLMPNDFKIAYKAIYDAVKSGEIAESRIDESVMKIMQCKADKGLF
ncbi:MAG: hypothetical protein E7415_02335 [Ruminococcaceae bacterium]|nr:hypothetical protein [Oscillospiraceae bacterium]